MELSVSDMQEKGFEKGSKLEVLPDAKTILPRKRVVNQVTAVAEQNMLYVPTKTSYGLDSLCSCISYHSRCKCLDCKDVSKVYSDKTSCRACVNSSMPLPRPSQINSVGGVLEVPAVVVPQTIGAATRTFR